MKKYAVVLLFFVGVIFGLCVVSQSFSLSLDEVSSGDVSDPLEGLSEEFPGFIPLSLSFSDIQSVYTSVDGRLLTVAPSGSGSFLNMSLNYPSVSLYTVYGFQYSVPVHIDPYSIVYLTVSTPSGMAYIGNSRYAGSNFTFSSLYQSAKLASASTLQPVCTIQIYDSFGSLLLTSYNYQFGTDLNLKVICEDPSDSLIVRFVLGGSVSGNLSLYSSFNVGNLGLDFDIYPVNYDHYLPLIYNQSVENGQYLHHISVNSDTIVQYLQDLSVAAGTPSEMEKFEDAYLERMKDQLSKVEDMMSSENTALPNGGDFAGFVSDVQNGLGVNGSSFNASDFAGATSKFGGSNATGPGGPWEFFSQSVQDSLAGDLFTIDLADDDYIYAWLYEAQRRYGLWNSSSP